MADPTRRPVAAFSHRTGCVRHQSTRCRVTARISAVLQPDSKQDSTTYGRIRQRLITN